MATALARDFPEIAALSRDELEELEHDEAYFDAVFHTLPQVRALYDAYATRLDEAHAAAQRNMSLRPELEQLRSETKDAFERARMAEAEWPTAALLMQEEYKVRRY